MEETFTYDDMNRLTGITLKRPSGQDLQCSVTYDALGRMTSREAVTASNGIPQVTSVFSQPVFDATKVHALASATTAEGVFPSASQTVTYTGFDKVSLVKQGKDSLCYAYGYDRQRILMEEHFDNTLRTKRYVGNCEFVTETEGNTTVEYSNTYLTGPYGVFAVVQRSGNNQIHYVLKDNLGNWTTVTDGNGLVEQQLSFDPWGNLRNPNNWANYPADDFFNHPMFDRGFTGHEHLSDFGLVNMNGRVYDPVVCSFLSADRYIQNPMSTQGFNRYAYCMYNPLRYVDPSGWLSGGGGGMYYPRVSTPKSPLSMIQDYLSDPCYFTRQQLREAGIYDIEGGYGFYGGGGTMNANWMEGDGSVHHSSWNVQTEDGGFNAGAWAIPVSFNPMWENYCQGFCNYGYTNYNNISHHASTSFGYLGNEGSGNHGGGIQNSLIGSEIQKIVIIYVAQYELDNIALGTIIASFAGSDFNKKMFWNYWLGKGDYKLSSSEFEDIVSLSNKQIDNVRPSEWNGNPAFAVPVSLYGTIYENAIGTTTLYYDLNGNAIGIHEPYDFNLFPIRDSKSAQIKTTLVRGASLYNVHSKDFYINYNYYP